MKNKEQKLFSVRGLFMALLCMICMAGHAQKLTVSPVTVVKGQEAVVTINLEDAERVCGGQFVIDLPEGLSMVKNPQLTEVINDGNILFSYGVDTHLAFFVSMDPNQDFVPAGPIIEFTVAAACDAAEGETGITLSDIKLSVSTGATYPDEVHPENVVVPVNITGVLVPAAKLSVNPESIVVNGDGTGSFSLAISSNFEVSAMNFVITFPEGLTYEGFEKTNRVNKNTMVKVGPRKDGPAGAYGVVLANLTTNISLKEMEGDFITFKVKGSDTLQKISQITVTNASTATVASVSVDLNDVTVEVRNGKFAYDDALAVVASLETELQEALAKIAQDCPDVKERFTGDEISGKINDFRAAVDAAYADGSLNSDYDGVMAPAETIRAAIAALIAEANAAQKAFNEDKEADRVAANKAAYDSDMVKIANLQEQLDEAILNIRANYKDYEDVMAQDAVQKSINALKKAVEEAYAAVTEAGTYTTPLTEEKIAGVEADIAALVTAAKNEAERVAANTAAYKADLKIINELTEHLDNTIVEIEADYLKFEDVRANAEVRKAINDAKAEVEAAFEAVKEEGTYASPLAEEKVAELNASIDALLETAKDKARRAANYEKYVADITVVDGEQEKFDSLLEEIEENYPDKLDREEADAIQDAIEALRTACDEEYADTEEEGEYTSPLTEEILAALTARMEKLRENAETGIDFIGLDADVNVKIFTLDGVQVSRPVQGQTCIFVTPKGTFKQLVK